MITITCPKCGMENPGDAMNCKQCRVNLQFALEHPEEIERARSSPGLDVETEPLISEAVPSVKQSPDSGERSEQRQHEIRSRIEKIQELLNKKKWRAAKDELSAFEGLGTPPDAKGRWKRERICSMDNPEWPSAKALDQLSDKVQRHSLILLIPGVTAIGALGGALLSMCQDGSILPIWGASLENVTAVEIKFAFGAVVLFAIAASVYGFQWSGRYGTLADFLLAILSALAIAFSLIILVFAVIIALIILLIYLIEGGG